MHTKDTFRKRIVFAAGVLFIFLGVVFNPWLLCRLLSLDGILNRTSNVILASGELILIGMGLYFVIRKNFRFLTSLSLSFVSLTLSLAAAEIFGSHRAGGILMRTQDGSFGLKPNLDLTKEFGSTRYRFQTNSNGMRWREVSLPNLSRKERIALVGDSITFGCCADTLGKSFAGILDKRIPTPRFEVLNFGIPGYGPVEIKKQIQRQVLLFRPRYIILMFFSGNDFSDTFRSLNRWQRVISSIRDRAIYSYTLGSSTDDSFFSHPPYTENARNAIHLTLRTLEEIREICETNGIRLMLAAIPFQEQVYSPSLVGDGWDYRLPQEYLKQFANMNTVPYLDLLPELRSAWSREHKELYDRNDVHLNNEGHRVVGNLLTSFFETEAVNE